MRRARSMTAMMVSGVVGLLLVTGCADPSQLQIEQLQQKNLELQREKDELMGRLAKALSERDAAVARAKALADKVRELQGEMAQAPSGPPGWETSGPFAWTSLSTDFLFDSGKATLRAEGHAKLQEVLNTIRANFPDKAIWVLGHTDTDPIKYTKDKWQDNLDLSCNRAMTVYRDLQKLGVNPGEMVAAGQGEWFPRATNANRAGKGQNRRVEIIVVPKRPPIGTPANETPATPVPAPTPTEEMPGDQPAQETGALVPTTG